MIVQNMSQSGVIRMQQMFSQVQNIVISMLENIGYIYETNKINYQAKQYQQVILRLVCPVELFANQKSLKSISQKDYISYNKNKAISAEIEKLKRFNNLNSENSATEINNEVKDQWQSQGFPRRRQGYLGDQMEEEICKKAHMRVKKKGFVLRRDIVHDAIALAKQKGLQFQGSSGWFTRFLRRNPDVRELLQNQKFIKRQQVMEQSESLSEWKLEFAQQEPSNILQINQEKDEQRNQTIKKKHQSQAVAKSKNSYPKIYPNNLRDDDIYGLDEQS